MSSTPLMGSLSDAKVMITGASGFLGTHLSQRLCQISGEVHATSRTQRSTVKGGPIWWQTDLQDVGAVRSLFENVKPDIIFHMSGLASAIQTLEFVLPTFHSLLTSTVNLLTVASEVGCRRIVLASSLNEPQADDSEMIPSSPYAAAKWASSGYGRMFHALYGTPLVMVRTFMTYGPGQDSRKLIPSVVLSLLKGEAPKISGGKWSADWVYIDDVIDGFIAAAQMSQVEGVTLDLGSGTLVTVRELVENLVSIVGCSTKPLYGALPDRVLEPARKADIVRTFQNLGWKPTVSLERGLQQTVEWYSAQLSTPSPAQQSG